MILGPMALDTVGSWTVAVNFTAIITDMKVYWMINI